MVIAAGLLVLAKSCTFEQTTENNIMRRELRWNSFIKFTVNDPNSLSQLLQGN